MYQDTITIFNFHKASGLWYPSVISGVDVIENASSSASRIGTINADVVEIIINSTQDRKITTLQGEKQYITAKIYAECTHPEDKITFNPECDFIYSGEWNSNTPISESNYETGLYHELNNKYDGIYMITTAVYYSLIPHFEIGGR